MSSPFCRIALVVSALVTVVAGVTVVGCTTPIKSQSKPLLTPARLPPHSVGIEIFFIRCSADDPRVNQELWTEVDETPFAVESRRVWAQNGFRVGVVAGQVPNVLAELMDMKSSDPPNMPDAAASADKKSADKKNPQETDADKQADKQWDEAASLASGPRVTVRQVSLRPGQRSEVIASAVYDEWPVLTCEGGDVSGQTYSQAQGIFAMKIANQRDGRVQLNLVPELHHGQSKQRWVGEQGVLRLEAGRSRRSFDKIAIVATLARGQILAISSLPNRPGSLGSYFFADKQKGKVDKKLLLIRLTQTQHDDILPTPDAQAIDGVR